MPVASVKMLWTEGWDFEDVYGEFSGMDEAVTVMEDFAGQILEDAQRNAPWSDRTGSARAGLGVDIIEDNNSNQVGLELYHSVDYGRWLETIQDGNFAIIMPTLEKWAPAVFAAAGAQVELIQEGDI